jgi:signal transduction histidine kinase
MRWGLRWQLLLPSVLLLLGIAGISAWTAAAAADRAREEIRGRMRAVARTLREAPVSDPSRRILVQMKYLSGADFLLVRADGSRTTTLDADPHAILPPEGQAHADWRELGLDARVNVSQTYLCSGIRLNPPRQNDVVYVLYPEALWVDSQRQAVWPSLVVGGSVGLASIVLGVLTGGRLVRRVQELERRTRRIAGGDFSPLPLPRRDDELTDLARSINDMAEQLARLQEAVRTSERLRLLGQVSAGLAHQLRNGVTGARLAVQLYRQEAEDWAADRGSPPEPHALEVALRQLTLVENHLKRFLDLGRGEPPRFASCSVSALVEEVLTLLGPQSRHTGVTLQWTAPPEPLTVRGDAGQLQQALLNIVGNALEAAGPGGSVTIQAQRAGDECRVEVTDTGPGLSAEIAGRLFEPFVTGKPEGVGLGLAVAQQILAAHQGRLAWSRQEERTVFRLELPIA